VSDTQNPYEAPRAAVVDSPLPPITGRPAWVWVICIYNAIGVVAGVGSAVLSMFDPGAMTSDVIEGSLAIVESLLLGAFTVQLFRMRRNALTLGVASLVFSFAMFARRVTDPEYMRILTAPLWVSIALSFAISIVIVLYVRWLWRRGALRA